MHNKQNFSSFNGPRTFWPRVTTTLAVLLSLSAIGCLSSLQKHSAALSAATTPVIEEAATAYRSANELHDTWLDYDAVAKFDAKQGVYNPESIRPLLDEHGIEVRMTVLAAFRCYVQSLVDIANGVNSPQLEAASASVGSSLTGFANQVAPSVESTLGIAVGSASQTTVAVTTGNTTTTTTSASSEPTFSPTVRNAVSTAANALGQFLVSRKIKKELPSKIREMDPQLEVLCKLLEDDINVIKSQEKIDYENILDSQTLFIRMSPGLQPQERREQIMKLPAIVRERRATEEQLTDLQASIQRLYMTHHALAADAQGNNPESLKAKLGELAAAGGSLGAFYGAQSAH